MCHFLSKSKKGHLDQSISLTQNEFQRGQTSSLRTTAPRVLRAPRCNCKGSYSSLGQWHGGRCGCTSFQESSVPALCHNETLWSHLIQLRFANTYF